MENFLTRGISLRGAQHILNNDRLSTLILTKNKDEIRSILNHYYNLMLASDGNYDFIYLDEGCKNFNFILAREFQIEEKSESLEDFFKNLLNYAYKCKKLIIKNGFKTLDEYNFNYQIYNVPKTVVVISDFDGLIREVENPKVVKDCILQLLKLEEYSGICLMIGTSLKLESGLDFIFMNAFANRVLFSIGDNKIVLEASNGMYKSTEMLSENEFYYFTANSSNGIMLCV